MYITFNKSESKRVPNGLSNLLRTRTVSSTCFAACMFFHCSLWLTLLSPQLTPKTAIFWGNKLCNLEGLPPRPQKKDSVFRLSLLRCILFGSLFSVLKIRFHRRFSILAFHERSEGLATWLTFPHEQHQLQLSGSLLFGQAGSLTFPQLLPLHSAGCLLLCTRLCYMPGPTQHLSLQPLA